MRHLARDRKETDLNQLQSNEPQTDQQREPAGQCDEQGALPNLTGASYAIGRLLGEVWDHASMDLDEFRVISIMCFNALGDGISVMSLDDILRASGLKLRRGRRAVEHLAAAGFVRIIPPSIQDLERGQSTVRYELWSSLDLDS